MSKINLNNKFNNLSNLKILLKAINPIFLMKLKIYQKNKFL